MKSFKLLGPIAALMVATLFASATHAQMPTRMSNTRHFPGADATTGQTFATTSYADLVGASITVVPVRDNSQVDAGVPNATDRLYVSWSADVSKATATTGECAIYVNGAVVAKTARFAASAAGRATIGGNLYVQPTNGVSQAVKLQCRSADTNIFSVANAQLWVLEVY